MTRSAYFSPHECRTDILVPVTARGEYCDIHSDTAVHLYQYDVTERSESPESEQMFKDILPYALVDYPGQTVYLNEFVRYVARSGTIRWMARRLKPSLDHPSP